MSQRCPRPLWTPTDRGSDEWRRVSDVVQAFSLDEIRHVGREVLVVGLDVVLQYQATQRTGGFVCNNREIQIALYRRLPFKRERGNRTPGECTHTFRLEAGEDKDEIVVEVWKLVELLQFLSGSVKDSNTCADIGIVYYNRLSCLYDDLLQFTTTSWSESHTPPLLLLSDTHAPIHT